MEVFKSLSAFSVNLFKVASADLQIRSKKPSLKKHIDLTNQIFWKSFYSHQFNIICPFLKLLPQWNGCAEYVVVHEC